MVRTGPGIGGSRHEADKSRNDRLSGLELAASALVKRLFCPLKYRDAEGREEASVPGGDEAERQAIGQTFERHEAGVFPLDV